MHLRTPARGFLLTYLPDYVIFSFMSHKRDIAAEIDIADLSKECTARTGNGSYKVGSLMVRTDGVMVSIRGISRRFHRALSPSLELSPEDMDHMCSRWISIRAQNSGNAVGPSTGLSTGTARAELRQIINLAGDALENLKEKLV